MAVSLCLGLWQVPLLVTFAPFYGGALLYLFANTQHAGLQENVAVPCCRLGRLCAFIRADLPPCPAGLWATWKESLAIVQKQKIDPNYQFVAELPAPRAG